MPCRYSLRSRARANTPLRSPCTRLRSIAAQCTCRSRRRSRAGRHHRRRRTSRPCLRSERSRTRWCWNSAVRLCSEALRCMLRSPRRAPRRRRSRIAIPFRTARPRRSSRRDHVIAAVDRRRSAPSTRSALRRSALPRRTRSTRPTECTRHRVGTPTSRIPVPAPGSGRSAHAECRCQDRSSSRRKRVRSRSRRSRSTSRRPRWFHAARCSSEVLADSSCSSPARDRSSRRRCRTRSGHA